MKVNRGSSDFVACLRPHLVSDARTFPADAELCRATRNKTFVTTLTLLVRHRLLAEI